MHPSRGPGGRSQRGDRPSRTTCARAAGPVGARAAGLVRRLRARTREQSGGDGFILLETLVAITIIAIIMTALTSLFVSVIGSTNHQRNSQAAAQVADTAADKARVVGAAAAVDGRTAAAVTAQFQGATPATPALPATAAAVAPWVSAAAMTPASAAGSSAILPTTATAQVVGSQTFYVSYFVGTCLRLSSGATTTCLASQTGGSTIPYVRVVVVVAWNGEGCGQLCTYITSVLLNDTADPVFDLNQAPPPNPVITAMAAQTWAVGEVATLALTTTAGVPAFTWSVPASGANVAPPGVTVQTLSVNGKQGTYLSGTPTTAGTYPVVVTVSDGFTHTATANVSIKVNPKLTITTPAAQSGDTGVTPTLALTSAGGVGPFTWSATGLPTGLNVNSSGQITGTPTTAGVYAPMITVTDPGGGSATTTPFSWTVYAAPTITAPTGAVSTAATAATITPAYTCANAPCTFTLSGNPAWLTENASTGVLTASTASTAGTTSGLKITIKDKAGVSVVSSSFAWTVNPKPTITTPANQVAKPGAVVSYTVTATCLTTPCGYKLNGTWPSGWTISNTGVISGTAPTTAKGYTGLSVTVTDADGVTATTATFTWSITNMVWGSISTQTTPHSTTGKTNTKSFSLAGLVTGASGTVTYSLTSGPTWIALSGSTLTATAPTSTTSSSVTVTATDSTGASVSTTFTWTIT